MSTRAKAKLPLILKWLGSLLGVLILLWVANRIYLDVAEKRCKEDGEKVVRWIESERMRSGSLPSSIGIPTRFEWHYHAGDGAYHLRTKNYYAYRLLLSYDSPRETWMISNY